MSDSKCGGEIDLVIGVSIPPTASAEVSLPGKIEPKS
jgi:hypothetical protein